MKRHVRFWLALFLAFAVLVQYSFSPQILTAYGEDNAVSATQAAQQEEKADDKKAEDKKSEEKQVKSSEKETTAETEKPTEAEPTEEKETDPPAKEETKPDVDDETEASDPTEETTQETEAVEEDEEEADEEDEDEDVEYPAAKFSKTAGGMTVNISAPEGALPEGATVKVVAVRASEVQDAVEELIDDGKVVKAVDITFYNKKGKEIEPKKKVSVSFVSNKFGDLSEPAVVHIDDQGNAERVAGARVNTNNNTATFKSDEFSVYAVIESVVPRLTVVFKNGNTEIASMIIKESDTAAQVEQIIYDPGAGDVPSGQVFKGWTTNANYTASTELSTIADVRSDAMDTVAGLTSDDTVTYYAAIFKQFKINYIDEHGISQGAESLEIPSRESQGSYTVNMNYTPEHSTQNFEGWRVSNGSGNIVGYPGNASSEEINGQTVYYYENGTTINITGNVTFSVNAPEGHWLVFDENGKGGKYNAPQFVKGENNTVRPCPDSEMVRFGYTFGGWYTNQACTAGNEFEFGHPLESNTTIYAKWNANATANYAVIIWKQNVAGDGYDFVESVTIENATVGTTPNAVSITGTGTNRAASVKGTTYRWNGFHYASNDQSEKTVRTEGDTVVNVYYDRNEITLNFYVYDYTYTETTSTSGWNTYYGLVDGQYVELTRRGNYGNYYWTYGNNITYNGTRYTRSNNQSWQTYQTMTGLYGSTLADNGYEWPNEYWWYESYNGGQGSGTRTTFLDAFLP